MKFHIYFVYILECSDHTYYIGVTRNLEARLELHRNRASPNSYTARRLPILLRYYKVFNYIDQAIKFEKQLKGWSRKKKEAHFIDDFQEIKRLSNKKTAEN